MSEPVVQSAIEVEHLEGSERLTASELGSLRWTGAAAGGPPVGLALGARELPLARVLSIRFPWTEAAPAGAGEARDATSQAPGARESVHLLLRAGDELAGVVTGGDPDQVLFRGRFLGAEPRPVPLAALKGLLVREESAGRLRRTAADAALRRLRRRVLSLKPEDDILFLRQGGEIVGILDALSAAGVRVSADKLGDLEVPFAKLQGLVLADIGGDRKKDDEGHENGDEEVKDGKNVEKKERRETAAGAAEPGGVPVEVTLRDGSLLVARATSLEGGELALAHGTLGPITLPLGGVLEITFLGGLVRYVSDLEPARATEALGAVYALEMPHRRDANVLDGPIRLGGRTYRKGLGVHSYSLLEYDLGEGFQRFQATIGLDDSAQPVSSEAAASDVASVLFRVRSGGKVLFEKAMTWRDPPLAIDVPLDGARDLALEVDPGGSAESRNSALDRADWAAARVVR